jgi:GH24 family phage-related lysozyme (muramidase)
MAHFFKGPNSDRRGYDASLNKQYVELDLVSDIVLFGGGDEKEKLTVVFNDPSIGHVTEIPPDPPDLRYFVVHGDRLGHAMLEARNSKGHVWAFMQVEVVVSVPVIAPPASASPGGDKNTVGNQGDAPRRVTSDAGKKWIKNSEALRLDYYDIDSPEAVKDVSKRNCTVGWGHLVHRGPCREGEAGQSITEAEAQRLFDTDVQGKERFVNSKKFSLTQTEFDAIVDLAFQGWPRRIEEPLQKGDKTAAGEVLKSLPGERAARRATLFIDGKYVDRGQR